MAISARERVRVDEAVVPSLWWFEVRNGLVIGERRGRLTERHPARFLRDISRLAVRVDRAPDETVVLTLARRHRLTVYDAAYLELALRESGTLATLDTALSNAAPREFGSSGKMRAESTDAPLLPSLPRAENNLVRGERLRAIRPVSA